MKLKELTEGTLNFNDKAEWVAVMKSKGADEFIQETEFNTTLIYAVGNKGTYLKGTWSTKKKTGIMFTGAKGDGMKFYKGYGKTKRTFKKANISEGTNNNALMTRMEAKEKEKKNGGKYITIRSENEKEFKAIPKLMYSKYQKDGWERV